jgi:hypothetical protein
MASLDEIFPNLRETTSMSSENSQQKLICPVCSNRAIRRDIHTGMSLCPIGHQWSINKKGQKQIPQGMFFEYKNGNKRPVFNDNTTKIQEKEYQNLVKKQYQNLERPRDYENFAWSTRNLKNGKNF